MNLNSRKIFIIGTVIICILCIILAIYFIYKEKDKKTTQKEEVIIDSTMLKENFNNIFDNNIDYQNNNTSSAMKKDSTKDLVYTKFNNDSKENEKYSLDINIPNININNSVIDSVNKEIEELFYSKINDIQTSDSNIETIYSVKYKAYVNDNILSLIISSNLKEGTNSQRLIIKTYNYNISSNELLDLNSILNYRSFNVNEAQNKVLEEIKESQNISSENQVLGYNRVLRNINDNMYKVENTNVFFLGEGKALYILYPYGNSNYTTELDLVII